MDNLFSEKIRTKSASCLVKTESGQFTIPVEVRENGSLLMNVNRIESFEPKGIIRIELTLLAEFVG